MAATTEKYLNLKNVRLTMGSGLVVDCLTISVKRNPKYIDRSPGMALTDSQVYNGEAKPDIMVEGFNSDDLSFGEIIPNDPVTAFTLMDTAAIPASVLQSDFFTKWPVTGWVWGAPDTDFNGTECSKWKVPIECGVMNPNAA